MTPLLPELASFPVFGTFDGELVAFDGDGSPDFPLICERMLMRRHHIRITYVIFDVLSLDGRSLVGQPYRDRSSNSKNSTLNELHSANTRHLRRRRRRVVRGRLRTRARRRGGEATRRPLPTRRARLDQDQEPRLLAVKLERESAINKKRVRQFV